MPMLYLHRVSIYRDFAQSYQWRGKMIIQINWCRKIMVSVGKGKSGICEVLTLELDFYLAMVWIEWVEIINFAVSKFSRSTNSVICGVSYFAAGSCNYILEYWIFFSSEVSTSEKNPIFKAANWELFVNSDYSFYLYSRITSPFGVKCNVLECLIFVNTSIWNINNTVEMI